MPSTQDFFNRQDERLKAFHEKITGSVNNMKASALARRADTDAKIDEWKRNREVNELENRAKDFEDYAEAAMGVLNLAKDEALQASLDAVEARLQAEDARAVAQKD